MSSASRDEQSVGQLFSELVQETRTLVRQELELAKTEMSEKASLAAKNIAFMVVGGAVLYAGLLAFIAALIITLGKHIGEATSAFAIAILVIVAGLALVMTGKNRFKARTMAPEQTKQQLKETTQWAKEQIR